MGKGLGEGIGGRGRTRGTVLGKGIRNGIGGNLLSVSFLKRLLFSI